MAKRLIVKFFLTLLFIFAVPNISNNLLAADDPGQYVMKMTQSAINTLTDKSISQNSKETQFGELFDKNFDGPSISRFVLGKYWKQASLDQKKKFYKSF